MRHPAPPGDETLGVAVADPPGDPQAPWVHVHRVDSSGNVAPDPWPISGSVPASTIGGTSLDAAMAVVWLRAGNGNLAEIVAQRVNADGTLGLPPVTGDANGDGRVDLRDLLIVLGAWGPCDGCPGDLDGSGVVDLRDLLLVLANWS